MSSTPVMREYVCTCEKFTDRCFRRAGSPGGRCFPCSVGNCGLGGTHGYGALPPEEIVEREVVPEPLQTALRALEAYCSRFSLHDSRPPNEESERVEVPIRILAAVRDAWWAYVTGAGK